jgi:hypothetical protein
MTPARPWAASVVALGIAGAFTAPIPARAAPALCEHAENYAAQSGAKMLRLNTLDLRPAGRDDDPVTDVGLGDAKSALIANAEVNSAAVTRMLDAEDAGDHTSPVVQQAPPTNAKASTRDADAGAAGPFTLGTGTLSAHAQWASGMACGAEDGEATRATATLHRASILGNDENALVAVRKKVSSVSTTALAGHGAEARTVASATILAGTIDLLGGAVRIKIRRAPSLTAGMSAKGGGEVRYLPAILEVSGDGIDTVRLDTAGDDVEITVADASPPTSPDSETAKAPQIREAPHTPQSPQPSQTSPARSAPPPRLVPGGPPTSPPTSQAGLEGLLPEKSQTESVPSVGLLGDLLTRMPIGGLKSGSPLPLPTVPGLPSVRGEDEAAQVAGPGTRLRISLGDVRQATSGHAIAARATTIKIALTQGSPGDRTTEGYGHSAPDRGGVVMDLDIGVLEAAAVAPEPLLGGVQNATSGEGGGLPITGPRVDYLAIAGFALLVLGAAATAFGMRRGRRRQ